ncbi:MAG: metallophosphoesterase family protein [Bacteroidia bacterium]
MSIKILHTADNHLCKKFNSRGYSDEIREALVEERFNCLERTVQLANDKAVDFLVIAGDLFDHTQVPQKDIKRTAQILNNFSGRNVVVLPGNHDFYESGSDKLWYKFSEYMNDDLLLLLSDCKPVAIEMNDKNVYFYPGPCNSKTSPNNAIGWVKDTEKSTEDLHIGIAHGSVKGYSPDMKHEYFLMTEEELRASGADFWLLGHIHVKYPAAAQTANPTFFYSSTPTPDGFDHKYEGFVWLLEIDEDKNIKMESFRTGEYRFYTLEEAVNSTKDIYALREKLLGTERQKALVKLKLNGRVTEEDKSELDKAMDDIRTQLAYVELDDAEVKLHITKDYIDRSFTPSSLPHRLLSHLSVADEDNLALQLANELIEKIKQ